MTQEIDFCLDAALRKAAIAASNIRIIGLGRKEKLPEKMLLPSALKTLQTMLHLDRCLDDVGMVLCTSKLRKLTLRFAYKKWP